MPIDTLLITVQRAVGVLSSLNPVNRADKIRVEQALQAVRTIAFFPSGVLSALKKIATGNDLDRDEAIEFYEIFREPGPGIQVWLDLLDPSRFTTGRQLSIPDRRALDSLRFAKLDVRDAISDFFRRYAEGDQGERATIQANRVIAQIEKLNRDLTKAEKLLSREPHQRKNIIRN
ncbi:MAG: hypothetical protein P4L68_10255 [Methylovirgula sp.]|nr:hypothetical protein [Methylovirgula sp.]